MPKKYSFNDRFFFEDSEQAFYWAGFIAADGNLYKNTLSIGLSSVDVGHLEKFRSHICTTHPIRVCAGRTKIPSGKIVEYKSVKISLTSATLPGYLARFNIIPRKTHIYTFPEWLSQHSLVHHFMRGYFDGDGCWSFKGKNRDQLNLSVAGTVNFLTVCSIILNDKCNITSNTKIRSVPGTNIIQYNGNRLTTRIRDFLYHDATVFLDRKFDLIRNVVAIHKIFVTPDCLIDRMKILGRRELIANELGCCISNIHRYVKSFGISEQMRLAKLSFDGGLYAR